MPILKVEHLHKQFTLHTLNGKEIRALSDISFGVDEGEIIGLTGKSGAGKSTLMKCLYRTYLANGGKILYQTLKGDIIDLVAAPDHAVIALRREEIRYCSQFLEVIPRVTAVDVVAERKIRSASDWESARDEARGLLEILGLPQELWDAYPATFSGGEQQRINIAQAIIARPRLLLIDEPTASLDLKTKSVVIEKILELKNVGTTVICISHDEYTLNNLVERRIHLKDGRLEQATVS